MCGITGIANIHGGSFDEHDILRQMTSCISHRGPDEENYLIDGPVGLGFRRLSIIDLATGSQPVPNENETIWAMLNGEIYNFIEIRRDLEARGHIFRTKSDTEVIVHAYEEFDLGFVDYLRGMFAIALWDNRGKRLVLARDRMGKKPLFYSVNNGQLAFSSEIKGLIPWPGFERVLSAGALHDYLTLLYVPTPQTIFSNVFKLPPAHFLYLDCRTGKMLVQRYWSLKIQEAPELTLADHQEALSAKLTESVRLRFRSDVPLGVFLSGGIDSTIVTGIAAKEIPGVHAYSIGFSDERFNELPISTQTARRFNIHLTSEIVDENSFSPDEFLSIARYLDEPFADSSFIPTYWVSKIASRHIKVALTGDGGDEIFAGYPRYPRLLLLQKLRLLPSWLRIWLKKNAINSWPFLSRYNESLGEKIRQIARALDLSDFSLDKQMTALHTYFDEKEKNKLYTQDWQAGLGGHVTSYIGQNFSATSRVGVIEQFMIADLLNGLVDDSLVKVDRASMACSLEVRSPFLDHELVELAMKIPTRYKYRNGISKWILKQTFNNLLSNDLLKRKKRGFEVPFAQWFQKENWRTFLVDMLSESKLSAQGIFNAKEVIRLRDLMLDDPEALHLPMSAYQLRHRVWCLLMFQVWSEYYG